MKASHQHSFRSFAQRWVSLAICVVALLLMAADDSEDNPDSTDNQPSEEAKVEQAVDKSEPAEPSFPIARVIRVPLPIKGETDTRIKAMIEQTLASWQDAQSRPTLVLEFRGTKERSGKNTQYERALSLARYLAGENLRRARTVAFLNGPVEGHAVLPVLACEEIIAHPDAVLGNAGISEPFIDDTVRGAYRGIAQRRRTIPAPVALGMLDREAKVYKAQSLDGVQYVLEDELQELKKKAALRSAETVIPQGELGSFSGSDLRLKFGFVSHLARDRRELATALGLPPSGLEEDAGLSGERKALRVELVGPVNSQKTSWLQQSIQQKIDEESVNFICLVIDSPGGSPTDSVSLATYLSSFDPSKVRTVAFVENEARSDAAIVALACDQLAVGEEATLGGPGAGRVGRKRLEDLEVAIRDIAQTKHRDWSLMYAMVDSEAAVHRYRQQGTGIERHFIGKELTEQLDAEQWEKGPQLETEDGLSGKQAADLGLAKYAVADFAELWQTYELDEDTLKAVRPNWAHLFIAKLASPQIAGTLLFVGWFALMAEFSAPGLGLPGFVAAICFLLYFWANFLHGTAGWLEVLLFAVGLVCVGLEIFVIPGFGIFGIGGGIMILGSIILASQTFVIPQNSYQFTQLPKSMFMAAAAGGGALVAAIAMRRLIAQSPFFRRLALAGPDESVIAELSQREATAHFDYLQGKRGVAATRLSPAGKARFGDEVVDVVSDGELIPVDSTIYVAEVHGNEVMVKAVEA